MLNDVISHGPIGYAIGHRKESLNFALNCVYICVFYSIKLCYLKQIEWKSFFMLSIGKYSNLNLYSVLIRTNKNTFISKW